MIIVFRLGWATLVFQPQILAQSCEKHWIFILLKLGSQALEDLTLHGGMSSAILLIKLLVFLPQILQIPMEELSPLLWRLSRILLNVKLNVFEKFDEFFFVVF